MSRRRLGHPAAFERGNGISIVHDWPASRVRPSFACRWPMALTTACLVVPAGQRRRTRADPKDIPHTRLRHSVFQHAIAERTGEARFDTAIVHRPGDLRRST